MSTTQPPPDDVSDDLSQRYDRLFRFGMDSDLTITCGPHSWRLHTAILTARSTLFATLCNPPSTAPPPSHPPMPPQPQPQHISLHHPSPWAVDKMLRYLYILEYFTLPSDHARFTHAADLTTHVHMCLLAQTYGIPTLHHRARARYETSLRAYLVGCQATSWHEGRAFHPHCGDEYASWEFWAELLAALRLACGEDAGLRVCAAVVVEGVLERWTVRNLWGRSVYRSLRGFLRRAYRAIGDEVARGERADWDALGRRVEGWRGGYVLAQEVWMRGHRGPWAEEWEGG